MKKALIILLSMVLCCALLTACECKHETTNTVTTMTPTLTELGSADRVCSECDEIVGTVEIPAKDAEVDVNDGCFNFTASEFIPWIETFISSDYSFLDEPENVGGDNWAYGIISSEDVGILILNYGSDEIVKTIMVTFTDKETSAAFLCLFAEKIDDDFDVDAAAESLILTDEYTDCGMTIVMGDYEGLPMAILYPEGAL